MGLDIKEDFLEVATRAGAKHLLDLKGLGPRTCRQSRQHVCEQELVWAFWEVREEPEVHWAARREKAADGVTWPWVEGPEPLAGPLGLSHWLHRKLSGPDRAAAHPHQILPRQTRALPRPGPQHVG